MVKPVQNASVDALVANDHPTAIAIGNFDGVHLGHLTLFDETRRLADQEGLDAIAVTFDPHPRQYFTKNNDPFLIQTIDERSRLIDAAGMDSVLILKFDDYLANMPPDQFIQEVLIDRLMASHVVVGSDFTFGRRAAGDIDTLKRADEFYTHAMPLLTTPDGGAISSTRIRQLIADGKIGPAVDLLGHPWRLSGDVVMGDKRGREIGFPTANVPYPPGIIRPAFGVYAVNVTIDGTPHHGMANIGIRPTYPLDHAMIEVYIFDFDQDIYDRHIEIMPVEKIRPEKKFDGLDALQSQLKQDKQAAMDIFQPC